MSDAAVGDAPSSRRAKNRPRINRWWWFLVILIAGYYLSFAVYPWLFAVLGVNHYGVWFLDTFALLASNDAVTRGLDPYQPNPLDYFKRPHVYPHAWLHLRDLGLTRADCIWLGWSLVAGFFAAAVYRLRPRNPSQLLWYLGVACSAPILLAVERANNDLVIFILLAGLVPCLQARFRGLRFFAPALMAMAALLKYYPAAAALVLLAGTDRREVRLRFLLTLLLLGLVGVSVATDLSGFGGIAPKPVGLLSFGATGFANGLGWVGWVPKAVCAAAAVVFIGVAWRRRWLNDWEPAEHQQSDALHFLLGAALLAGCFFTSQNFGYRWIFALWLAPLLWNLPDDPAAPDGVRRLARWLRWLLLSVLWWDTVFCFVLNRCQGGLSPAETAAWAQRFYMLEQPFDWALFLGLLVFLAQFARRRGQFLLGR
ncbi:MAG: hypothetical protein JWM32_861 [Verrucomicrobia bacterium]|nr:hypothetical protein [Verrucomicrobiota bacterium]